MLTTMDEPLKQAEQMLAELPAPVAEAMMRQWWEAATAPRPEAREPEFTTVPPPALPYGLRHPQSGMVRYHCMTGCGWFHDECPYLELPGPWVLPANFTSEDVAAAISAEAEQREAAREARIEEAMRDHYRAAHPGQEPLKRRVDSREPEPEPQR